MDPKTIPKLVDILVGSSKFLPLLQWLRDGLLGCGNAWFTAYAMSGLVQLAAKIRDPMVRDTGIPTLISQGLAAC